MKQVIILLLIYLSPAFIDKIDAQNINFSGKWTLNEEKTEIPGFPIVTLEIEQTADQIIYKGLVPQSSGDTTVTIKTMRLDGSEGKYIDFRGDEYKCSAFIKDGMLVTKYQSKQKRSGDFVILDIQEEHTLLDNGKTLSVIHLEGMEGKMGRYPNPLVFELLAGSKKEPNVTESKINDDENRVFTKKELMEDTRELLNYLESIHPDPYLFGGGKVAFHRRFQNLLQSIPKDGMTKDQFIKLIRPFVAAVADAHTAVLTSYDYERSAPGGIPLSFGSVEKMLYVDAVFSPDDKRLIGSKLIAVEAISFDELIRRVHFLRGIENDYHALLMLRNYLGVKPYLLELIPEWKDYSKIRVELELPSGKREIIPMSIPKEIKSKMIKNETQIKLPSTEKTDFAYDFLTKDKKTAILKVDLMTSYREVFESEMSGRDNTEDAAAAYEKVNGTKAPSDLKEILAGIPSAIDLFKQLLTEMKQAGTENLIIDLSKNPGGNSIMSDIFVYFLYGKKNLIDIMLSESTVKKYTPYYFQNFTGRTINGINQEYAPIQNYPLTENDYDFSIERYLELGRIGKIDTLTGLQLKFNKLPRFIEEIKSEKYCGYYKPKNIYVVTSHGTFSSATTFLRYLYKSGATVVGSTSAQSGNGFGNFMNASLKNTGIMLAISKDAYIVFPDTPDQRVLIEPHYKLTYDKLKSYNFDENAEILYALELMKQGKIK